VSAAAQTTFVAEIAAVIAAAGAAAEAGRMTEAMRRFDLCRALLVERAPQPALRRRIEAENASLEAEAARFAALMRARAAPLPERRVMIVADSLGLPRPEEADFEAAVGGVYASLIHDALAARGSAAVDAHCQRFFTTDDALALVEADPGRIAGAHLLVHLGLNDCAVRMFMPAQRLAVGLLPPDTAAAVVGFARTRRAEIVAAYPNHQYVPLDHFARNLAAIASQARRAGAASVTFATILTPPLKFWRRTPQVCRRFTAYNLCIMDVAAETGALVIDLDRLLWHDGVGRLAGPDGMHFSPAGHQAAARAFAVGRFGLAPKPAAAPAAAPAAGCPVAQPASQAASSAAGGAS